MSFGWACLHANHGFRHFLVDMWVGEEASKLFALTNGGLEM